MSLLLLLYGIETPEAEAGPEPEPQPETPGVVGVQAGLLLRSKRLPEVYVINLDEEEILIL